MRRFGAEVRKCGFIGLFGKLELDHQHAGEIEQVHIRQRLTNWVIPLFVVPKRYFKVILINSRDENRE
ncbi:hypothetical protein D3C87_1908890 [compost metagenome]